MNQDFVYPTTIYDYQSNDSHQGSSPFLACVASDRVRLGYSETCNAVWDTIQPIPPHPLCQRKPAL